MARDEVSREQIAIVTGAGGGMGKSISRVLHADGMKVLLTDINEDSIREFAEELCPQGETAWALQQDASQKSEAEHVLAECTARWGTPTVLVNNAAVTQTADPLTISQEDFDRVVRINTDSVFFGCQVIGQAMAEAGYGRIVNMGSLAGLNGGTATGVHYAASKGAIGTITKIFAKQYAAQGVTVNQIVPGPHDLPIVYETVPEDKLEGVIASIPVGKLGSPDFIGQTIALLASEEAYFVTGASWDINGGLYVR
ncbi:SDR family oxidoreductase [Pseudoglutamicibacter albus]|uniref:SDR family NAD(P)-dependent oxidoreductase n=1 Tax=Pseudoglutamicibacter albus TaxID=98671 RepID=UPI001EF43868|nr:SDR family oxidoreductase [Pseudoglutamicibacter albus]MCG7304454.1 SDR family oxidoreductase [Pseudoglutamicibacter albus]